MKIDCNIVQVRLGDNMWHLVAEHSPQTIGYMEDPNDKGLPFYRAFGFVFIPEEDPQSENPERYYTVVAVNPREVGEAREKG